MGSSQEFGHHHRPLWRTSAIVAAVIMLTACQGQDTSTNVMIPPSAGVLSSAPDGSQAPGLVQFACVLGRRDPRSPTFWQTRTDSMAFPRGDLDPQGRTVTYRFRRLTPRGALAFAANCAVPYTEQALRRVDQHYGVSAGGGADQFKARHGSITIQGCVTGGTCQLVEVVATGCTNPDWTMGEDGVCRSSRDGTPDDTGGGGADWGGGGGGSGGDVPGPTTASTNDDIAEQDTVPDCTQAQTTDWALAFCRSTRPAGARLDSTNAALNRMEQRGGACADLAREGRQLLSAGRLTYFVPQTGDAGGWGGRRYRCDPRRLLGRSVFRWEGLGR
jgi:hypothetical protein